MDGTAVEAGNRAEKNKGVLASASQGGKDVLASASQGGKVS